MSVTSTRKTIARDDLLYRLGDLVEACGSQGFPKALQHFFEHFCDTSEFSILTFHEDAVPVPLYSSVSEFDEDLKRYCSGIYLLDPFYIAYCHGRFSGFAKCADITPDDFWDAFKPYRSYMGQWGALEEAGYVFPVSNDTSLHFSFVRADGKHNFGSASINLLIDRYPFLNPLVARHWQVIDSNIGSQEVARKRLHDQVNSILRDFGDSVLTPRERQVVQLMLRGHSAKSIARSLSISSGTVQIHRANMYRKLDISSNGELFSLLIDAMISVEATDGQDILKDYLAKPLV